MAVTKLNKLTLITPKHYQERLLTKLQTMQFVEIENVFEQEANETGCGIFAGATPEGASSTNDSSIARSDPLYSPKW